MLRVGWWGGGGGLNAFYRPTHHLKLISWNLHVFRHISGDITFYVQQMQGNHNYTIVALIAPPFQTIKVNILLLLYSFCLIGMFHSKSNEQKVFNNTLERRVCEK